MGGGLNHIKSGIYNSVKYGLKGMRHKNANMYETRKYINSKNSVSATRACTGHRLVLKNILEKWQWISMNDTTKNNTSASLPDLLLSVERDG